MKKINLYRIDARTGYKPERAKELIQSSIEAVGSRAEVARRLGCSDQYLRLVLRDQRTLSYGLQVLIELLIITETDESGVV